MRIRVVDVESTGEASPEHGLCEIGYHDVVAQSTDIAGAPYDWMVEEGRAAYCHPGRPIPPETAAVHQIMDEDVAGAPSWVNLMHGFVLGLKRDSVTHIAGHSVKTELSWMNPEWWEGGEPIPSICTHKVALRLWPEAPLHSNQGLRHWRMPSGLDRFKALPPHRAGPDAYVTAFLLRDMLNAGCPVEQMVAWSAVPALLVRCRIGRFRNGGAGTPWDEVDDGMLSWILDDRRDFDEDTIYTVKHHIELRKQRRQEEHDRLKLNLQLSANGLEEIPPEGGGPEISNPLVDPSVADSPELPL